MRQPASQHLEYLWCAVVVPVAQGRTIIEGRPGASMPPMELDNLQARLEERYGRANITPRDVLSSALYPKVFEDYQAQLLRYSDLIEKLPTRAFLVPLKEDEEVEIKLSKVRLRAAPAWSSLACVTICACSLVCCHVKGFVWQPI